jgi:N-glycosylase/DNA lyase
MTDEFIDDVFLKEYLQVPQIDVEILYKDWAERDPKYFLPISKNLPGVRCLRQDPWECTLSFICSSNNNIKRIT